jgi:Organic Anion Transporter Polypeptide (OATP) family
MLYVTGTSITPEHPQWIGAWWIGYLICFIMNFLLFIPTAMLPTHLKPINNCLAGENADNELKNEIVSNAGYGQDETIDRIRVTIDNWHGIISLIIDKLFSH